MNSGVFDLEKVDELNGRMAFNILELNRVFTSQSREGKFRDLGLFEKTFDNMLGSIEGEHYYIMVEEGLRNFLADAEDLFKYHFWYTNMVNTGMGIDKERVESILHTIVTIFDNELNRFAEAGLDIEKVDLFAIVFIDFMLAGMYVVNKDKWENAKVLVEDTDLAKRIKKYHT